MISKNFALMVVACSVLLGLAACGESDGETPPAADTAAPPAPTGLVGAGSTQTTITLNWAASTDEAGGSGLKEYVLQRDSTQIAVVTAPGFTDTGLAPGTTYSYRVAARDNAGNTSAFTAVSQAATLATPDTTAPTTPTGLTGTSTSSTTVSLSWTISADNAGGSGVQNYVVQRDGSQVGLTTTPSFTDAGLSASTGYSYRVAAIDFAGNQSAFTNPAFITTSALADTTAPTAPSGLNATVSGTTVALAWTASTDSGGSGLKEYVVRRGGTQIAVVTGTTYNNTGLAPGTYSYDVAARDNAGNTSAFSSVASATVETSDITAPSVPTGFASTGNTQTSITLNWTASSDGAGGSGVKEYILQRDSTQIAVVATPGFTDTSLSAGTTYSYRVAARDNAGNTSALSPVLQAATLAAPDTTAPTAPSGLNGTATSSTTVSLTWTASTDNAGGSGVQNYVVQRNGVQVGLVTATNFADTGLAAGTGYSYRVASRDFAGNQSAFSNPAIVTTSAPPDTTAPTVPTGLTGTASGTTVALAWTGSTDSGGSGLKEYVVWRGGVQIAIVTGTTHNDTGLAAGSYSYNVAARDNAGNTSAFSATASATIIAPDTTAPSVPSGLTATASGTTIALAWTGSTDSGGSGLKEYVVRRGGVQIAIVTGTSFNDTGLAAGTYSYDVAARDNAGNTSALSAPASATVAGSTVVGLDTRPSNTSCIAPDRPSSTTGVTLTRSYANLSFSEPVGLVQAPGDNTRWFVLERGGRIRVFSNSPTVTTSSVFLDLSSRINDAGEIEAGLLGLAFHPDFASNGKFYVFYSGPNVPNYRIGSRISEFTSADRQTTSLATERELIRAYKLEPNHNGGQLQFGPDGYLYAGFGDGGGANDPEGNGQNRTNLFGKIIRIDVNSGSPYAIPPGNTYSGQSSCSTTYSPANPSAPRTANCPEIYAYGLRNPWRFSFDRAGSAADLWVADVGQGGFEEIDKIAAPGGNYGWSIREGSVCLSGGSCATSNNGDPLLPPVQDVPRAESTAIIGGFVYRGSAMSGLVGQYLYANFAPGTVYALTPNGTGGYTRNVLVNSSLQISTFGQDQNGEIYAVDFAGGGVYRLNQSGGGSSTVPSSLLATGCISTTNPTLPASGLIPYGPNAPFWSDGAVKDRWMALPNGTQATIGSDGDWSFPVGTVLMKNFRLANQLIETRLFMRHTDGEWAGYTYRWNTAQTDATRVQGGTTVTYGSQQWIYPSEAECLQCHTSAAGRSLSIENGQLNGNFMYPQTGRTANQIATLRHIGVIASSTPDPSTLIRFPSPTDTASGSLNERARAWLHTNCSSCHRPGGGTNVNMDFRYSTTATATNACNVDPVGGDLGVPGAKRILPNDAAHSLVYLRLNRRGANQMPPIGSTIVDTEGAALIQEWINQGAGCP